MWLAIRYKSRPVFLLNVYSLRRCCRVIYTGSNSSIYENAVPFKGGILQSG